MDILNGLFSGDALHTLSQGLLVPTILLLVLLSAWAVYSIGSLVVEVVVERRHYRVAFPKFVASLDASEVKSLNSVIDASGLLVSQREILKELVSYLYLPADALTEVARNLLSREAERYERVLSMTESAAKVSPMLGLMGTLIPLGPGIISLGSGNLETLSSSLLIAFDTTVAGLAVAVVCYLITKVRRRWYNGYLESLEGAMNTILEKSVLLKSEGYKFEKVTGGQDAGEGDCYGDA